MTIRVGLMGFGRIGRNVFRMLHRRADVEVAAIADIADPAGLTYLLRYDSIYGRFPGRVEFADDALRRRTAGSVSRLGRAWRRPVG